MEITRSSCETAVSRSQQGIDKGMTVVLANHPRPLLAPYFTNTSYPKHTSPESPPKGGDVEAQGGFSSSNGVLEVKPGEARQETPFLPALAGTLP